MVNVWKFANALPNLTITTTEGDVFFGKVIGVFDSDESGEAEDSLALELESGQIISFLQSEIKEANAS